ncbi:transcriptional regulator [Staphylococcus equorum]|uniref:Transcriptional regulator n=1 Tax=Staphylococcus equorum TaxID=246432 RepID=A0A9X4QWQ5_9STAP|nr:transcriptional regulator [Staphylococcus equorum]MDG0819002.1 transcriptional regulator [Staphylococcus equorum]MDG0839643.1 transcriptional regulator [Staphylococcus equorum]MDG0844631.1 transcriptional regulator [Staphylococcus equorum]
MRKSTINYLESELIQYNSTQKRMADLKEEIQYPWQEQDTNIGGGKSNTITSTTEKQATRLITDKRLAHMHRVSAAITTVYEHAQPVERDLMDLLYFDKPRRYTVDGIICKLPISRATFFRLKKRILHNLADELGIIY